MNVLTCLLNFASISFMFRLCTIVLPFTLFERSRGIPCMAYLPDLQNCDRPHHVGDAVLPEGIKMI